MSRSDNDGSVTSFGYDGANQLTSEVRTGTGAYSIGYLYDNNGNRTQKTTNGVPEVYTYGPNDRILTAGPRSYVTDNNGNVTSVTVNGQTTGLTYDFENRLIRIDLPGGGANLFRYNGLGLRVRKEDSSGTVTYLADGADVASPIVADSSATYTPGISERRGGVSKFIHPDHLGSTRGITNSSQTATDSMLFDSFGSLLSRTGTTPTPFGYVGQEQYQTDPDSGLMMLGHRYYDSYTGRFISQDPIGDDRNWYGYVGNNPQGWVDPFGLRPESPKSESGLTVHKRVPKSKLGYQPTYRGGAPRDKRGVPIELDHRDESNADEKTRKDHREGPNYRKNHPDTSQPSKIDRKAFGRDRRRHWRIETDSGRFDHLPRLDKGKIKSVIGDLAKRATKKVPIVGWIITGYALIQTMRNPNATAMDYIDAIM